MTTASESQKQYSDADGGCHSMSENSVYIEFPFESVQCDVFVVVSACVLSHRRVVCENDDISILHVAYNVVYISREA